MYLKGCKILFADQVREISKKLFFDIAKKLFRITFYYILNKSGLKIIKLPFTISI